MPPWRGMLRHGAYGSTKPCMDEQGFVSCSRYSVGILFCVFVRIKFRVALCAFQTLFSLKFLIIRIQIIHRGCV